MRVLVLSAEKQDELKAAVERAAAKPIPIEVVAAGAVERPTTELKLADRKPGFSRPLSEAVMIPHGYMVAFSVEEQPGGLCNHLSVSVDKPGMLPSPDAVAMIADACGMEFEQNIERGTVMVWLEEFDPGHQAVNVVTVREPRGTH